MTVRNRIHSLNTRHHELEEKLHDAYVNRLSAAELKEIKKQKLLIKDEIKNLLNEKMAA